MVEWSILAVVIVLLVLVFVRQVWVLKGQAELSAVKTTLGALRTAFVLDHLHSKVASRALPVWLVQHNPFELLQRYPVNYLGEMTAAAAQTLPPGSWVFDPACTCVGYLPLHAEWLDSPSGDVMAWFRVEGEPGPLQLTAIEAYVWQDQVMN
jgi:hypothetical protein